MKQTIKSAVLAASLSVLSMSAFALDSTSIDIAGVNVTPVSPSGSGGALNIPSEIHNLVAGHETELVSGSQSSITTSYGGGWFSSTAIFYLPSFKVRFPNKLTAIVTFNDVVKASTGTMFYPGQSVTLHYVGFSRYGASYCFASGCIRVNKKEGVSAFYAHPYTSAGGYMIIYRSGYGGGSHLQKANTAAWLR